MAGAAKDWTNFFKMRLTSGQCGTPIHFPPEWGGDELDAHDEDIAFGGNNKSYDDSSSHINYESYEPDEESDDEPIDWFRHHRRPAAILDWFTDDGAGPASGL